MYIADSQYLKPAMVHIYDAFFLNTYNVTYVLGGINRINKMQINSNRSQAT